MPGVMNFMHLYHPTFRAINTFSPELRTSLQNAHSGFAEGIDFCFRSRHTLTTPTMQTHDRSFSFHKPMLASAPYYSSHLIGRPAANTILIYTYNLDHK